MHTLLLRALFLATCAVGAVSAQTEDDRENDTPTGTYWSSGQTPAQINSRISQGWRLTDLQIESTSPYTFTVAMVPNSGAYAISTWWYYGIDAATVSANLSANNARLTDLEVVDNGSGSPRFSCIMVSNTGANAKSWGWLYNTNTTAIANLVAQGNRIVDLERYVLGSTTYYACVVIRNSGADARSWWYYYDVSQASLDSLLSQNNARIYDLDRASSSTYDVVMVRQGSQKNWRYYGITAQQLTDHLSQIGARAIDIERYSTLLGTRYNAVLINNSNALSTRISELLRSTTDGDSGVYLKRANGSVLAYINGDRPHEPASTLKTLHLAHAIAAVHAGQTTLGTNYVTFTGGGPDSCPGATQLPVVESLQAVLDQMMDRSDNTRTRTVTDNFGGFLSLNVRATALGMTSTQVNHHIGCGTPANVTTLRDIAHLHEEVINGYLGSDRDTFYGLMRQDYQNGGYASGELWPVMQAEAATVGLSTNQFNAFRAGFMIAFKKGGYTIGTNYFRCWGGYVRIPFYVNGSGVVYREYMVGSFVSNATDEPNAIAAANAAAAEVLRDELHAAMLTYATWVPGSMTLFGTACAGTTGLPSHAASGVPELGQTVHYELTNGPRSTPVVLFFGASNTVWNGQSLPLDLTFVNAPGCFLRTDSQISVGASTNLFGAATVNVTLPISTPLVGTTVFTQFVIQDARANRLGLTTTQGVRTFIGGRG